MLLVLSGMAMSLSGCSVVYNAQGLTPDNDGGVFKSANKGNTWAQKTLFASLAGKALNIRGLDVNTLEMDPSDPLTLYLGSLENGLYYTYDQGETWQASGRLGKIKVNSLAVDPNSKCVLYAATQNQLYKSTDCGRFWDQAYFDNDPSIQVSSVAVNPGQSAQIFIATSRGEVIKSADAGKTWRTAGRLEKNILKIVISPQSPNIIFAGTASNGLFRSKDYGESWENLNSRLKEFQDNNQFRDLSFSRSDSGTVFLANHYGLLKSTDNGDNWTNIKLITPKEAATINAIAVNPAKSSELYYVTNTTFYHSTDGGENWSSKKLPGSRMGWKLVIDPDNPNTVYLGMKKK